MHGIGKSKKNCRNLRDPFLVICIRVLLLHFIIYNKKMLKYFYYRFVNEWRMFVRNPHLRDVVTLIPNQILLCSHGGLVYPLDLSIESDYESV